MLRRFDFLSKLCLLLVSLCFAGCVFAEQVEISAAPGNRLLIAGRKNVFPLRVSLVGADVSKRALRNPVNVALVIDRSGSMTGEKMVRAKEAATSAIERLLANDIVSVITYDDVVDVVVPATKITSTEQVIGAIARIEPRGDTALFAGVSAGAKEVRKFLERNKVNRVILISDGIANVGPSSPGELGNLGASLAKDGISVTTIGLGLGYNEDLMTQLAGKSDGNHAFVENSADLARVFQNELGDIQSIVAQDINIRIRCHGGYRPLRVVGRDADINGQTITLSLNQVNALQEKYLIVEVESPEGKLGNEDEVAVVEVEYANMSNKQREQSTRSVRVGYTASETEAEKSSDKRTFEAYYTMLNVDANSRAIALRDANKKDEAKAVLQSNAASLRARGEKLGSADLKRLADKSEQEMNEMDERSWQVQRKELKSKVHAQKNQAAELR